MSGPLAAKQVTSQFLTIDGTKPPPGVPYNALGERIGAVADPVFPQDAVTLAWIAANIPAAGVVPNRRDHSVNGAIVENYRSINPVMKTQTNVNPAGSYTGGGTGNKSILGHYLPGPPFPAGGTMPLGSLVSIEYTYDRLAPEVTGTNIVPYVNLMVQLAPGLIVVMVIGDFNAVAAGVPNGVFTPAALPVGPVTTQNMLWTAAANLVLVVNFEGMATPPAPPSLPGPWAPIVTPSFGPAPSYANPIPPGPATPSPGNWPGTGYKIGGGGPTDILTAYPGAIILNVDPLDDGLPKLTTMSGITLNIGDSTNFIQNAIQILDWKINGVPV